MYVSTPLMLPLMSEWSNVPFHCRYDTGLSKQRLVSLTTVWKAQNQNQEDNRECILSLIHVEWIEYIEMLKHKWWISSFAYILVYKMQFIIIHIIIIILWHFKNCKTSLLRNAVVWIVTERSTRLWFYLVAVGITEMCNKITSCSMDQKKFF
jgi:hypothetical protein